MMNSNHTVHLLCSSYLDRGETAHLKISICLPWRQVCHKEETHVVPSPSEHGNTIILTSSCVNTGVDDPPNTYTSPSPDEQEVCHILYKTPTIIIPTPKALVTIDSINLVGTHGGSVTTWIHSQVGRLKIQPSPKQRRSYSPWPLAQITSQPNISFWVFKPP